MKHVLVIYPFVETRGLIKHVLADGGYSVSEAASQDEIAFILESISPDIILMADHLVDLSCFELALKLKKHPKCRLAPLLLLSNQKLKGDCFLSPFPEVDGFIQLESLVSELLNCVDAHTQLKDKKEQDYTGWQNLISDFRNLRGELETFKVEYQSLHQEVEQNSVLVRTLLDAIPAQTSILDQSGTITAVNLAWKKFGQANGANQATLEGTGLNYLEVCRCAQGTGELEAQQALQGLASILDGQQAQFTFEYSVSTAQEMSRYLFDSRQLGSKKGAVVIHHCLDTLRPAEISN